MKALVWPVLVLSLLTAHVPPGVAQETIHIRLVNAYAALIDLGFAKAERNSGEDIVEGTLTLQTDGTWKGEVQAKVSFMQEMKAFLGPVCTREEFKGSQRLLMSGRTVSGFNSKVQTIAYRSGRATEFLVLAVRPAAAPNMTKGDTNCLSMYTYEDGSMLLPLNDSRWLPEAGYTIGLPQSGMLEYDDDTVNTGGGGSGVVLPVRAVGRWRVHVDRP